MPDPKGEWSLIETVDGNNSDMHHISNQQTKIQVPESNIFQGILLTSLKC